ncbi:50S ribosomal protein L35 [Candidatus Gracilibacteria bacterium]|jgi:large subunit ribosomal protein L35|nr:50S ribosomal protein L35 [Candidatus Gracilibacteria bacterium]
MKAKTHSGSQKRVKVTATGKFRTAKIGKRHLLQNKSQKSKGKGKYGVATHVANERKMKWGHQVAGLRTPTAKKNIVQKTADGKIIKAPRRAPVIKTVAKQVSAPKTTKVAAPKKAPAKAIAKKSAPKKK